MSPNPGRGRPPFDLVLHAGPHKTGTTAFQRFMKAHRDRFDQCGLYVPEAGQDWTGSHAVLAHALGGHPQAQPALAALAEEIAARRPERVLISAEESKRHIVEGQGARMIGALRDMGARDIRIIFYLRSPFALTNALYSQWTMRRFALGHRFAQFVRTVTRSNLFDYDKVLALGEIPGVTLTVRPYPRAEIVQDMLTALGLDWPVAEDGQLNRTFGPIAVEASRRLCLEYGLNGEMDEWQLTRALFRIGLALDERKFWGVDDGIEAMLADADAKTEMLSQATWTQPWRETIPVERNPLNMFDPETAPAEEVARFEAVMAEMRAAVAATRAEGDWSTSAERGRH